MTSQQEPDPAEKFRSCTTKLIFSLGGLIVLFVLVSYLVSQTMEYEPTTASPTSVFDKPAATDAPPDMTFAQWRDSADTIPYDDLARFAKQHEGQVVHFRGRVGHISVETSDYSELWVYVARDSLTGTWNEKKLILHCHDMPYRVLVDDMISFVAVVDGISTIHKVPELITMALEVE